MKRQFIEEFAPKWDVDSMGNLVCPCGHLVEDDGTCPEGHVSPMKQMGMI